jgi:hypothetical protein
MRTRVILPIAKTGITPIYVDEHGGGMGLYVTDNMARVTG